MIAPSTVTEAVQFLRSEGYSDDIEPAGEMLACGRTASSYDPVAAVVDHTFRFEGESDPGDEAIVLGLRFPDDVKGVLVSAFGPGADPGTAEFLSRLREH